MRTQKATCRLCGGVCGMVATVDDGERLVDVRELMNSALHDAPAIRKRMPFNAAHLHPDEMIGSDRHIEPINAMTRMTGVPVSILRGANPAVRPPG